MSQIATRALEHEAAGAVSSVDFANAFKRCHDKLARVISPIVGDMGFDAMFARAIRKTRSTEPSLDGFIAAVGAPFSDQLWAWLGQREPATIRSIGGDALARFLEFLTKLIGEELVLKLVRAAWPESDVPVENS